MCTHVHLCLVRQIGPTWAQHSSKVMPCTSSMYRNDSSQSPRRCERKRKLPALAPVRPTASGQRGLVELPRLRVPFSVTISYPIQSKSIPLGDRARHGFANPRGYPGMGGTGTGTGRLKVTHQKPTPVARVWRVFPGTRITKRHMRHISLPPPSAISDF